MTALGFGLGLGLRRGSAGAGAQAPVFDAATPQTITGDGSTTNWSFNHTCTGSNRMLLVGVHVKSLTITVTGITYNGVALTKIDSDANSTTRAELWYLKNPASGANSVSVTFSAAYNSGRDAVFGAVSYTGVHQTAAIGTAVKANGSSTTAAAVVTSTTGELVVSSCAAHTNSGNVFTAHTPATSRVNVNTGTNNSFDVNQGQSESAGAASVTMQWDLTQSGSWAIVAVPLKPA